MIFLVGVFNLRLELLIMVVNVNLLIGYIASIAAFIKINRRHPARFILGVFSLVLCIAFMAVFSYVILYAIVLMLLPVVPDLLRRIHRGEPKEQLELKASNKGDPNADPAVNARR